MTADLLLFLVLAVVAVASAVAMLVSRNAVYAAIFLILNFSTIAIFYLLLAAPFIAMAQITVYAGAIMVLFLFVIMLLGGQTHHTRSFIPWQAPLAILLGVALAVEVIYVLITGSSGLPALTGTQATSVAPGFGGPQAIGEVLFNQYLLPFEVTSILLLVAMIGAIVLTQKEKEREREQIRQTMDQTIPEIHAPVETPEPEVPEKV
ncbi:MAG: NADH-quinone oxidoreductase subunit J [Chloroflexota bacterium]|nr:MAG: NADH-quinone oxidoreductase subunit J [Chloroflexota bacterium]